MILTSILLGGLAMLDFYRLAIRVYPWNALQMPASEVFHFVGDSLTNLGLGCGSRSVGLDEDGKVVARDLYIKYDKLGSDYSDMAVKFYHQTRNALPYLEVKASPAKLLQGHNVYGSDDLEQGALEMLGMVIQAFPKLCQYLNFNDVEVLALDCTYSCRLPSQRLVQPCIDFLSNISSGHAISQNTAYENYTRWGRQDGRYLGRKAYGKYDEVLSQIKEIEKKPILSEQDINKYKALQNALSFADALLRFEARICKPYLVKNDYPTNLYKLIELQRQQPDLLQTLWGRAFEPIFNSLKGCHMNLNDDIKVKELLRSKLFTITKKGNVSYTKADNLYNFYKALKSDGYDVVKKNSYYNSLRTFQRNVSLLVDCGISKSHLQNLHNQKPKVIPMDILVNLDFTKQTPDDFISPKSRFYQPKTSHLRLVA